MKKYLMLTLSALCSVITNIWKWIVEKKNSIKKFIHGVRYQKLVTSFLYIMVASTIVYTFYIYWHVSETVNPEIYSKTMDVLLGLLGVTGGLKGAEVISDTVKDVMKVKYSAGVDMRGE